jgi:hypothetical protein
VCGIDIDCVSNICEDTTCCATTCAGACKRCDVAGSQGTCKNVDVNLQVTGCTGSQACDGAGNCKTKNGQSCVNNTECLTGQCQDGVCCNAACSGACARCDIAGSVGTCKNVDPGGQVANCTGTMACDGNNNCRKVDGQSCGGNNECSSGNCVDEDLMTGGLQGICCNTSCTELCKSCDGSKTEGGVNGVCDLIKTKTDPDEECPNSCNTSSGNGCCFFNGSMNICK